MERVNYGSVVIGPPNFLFGHLSLLNIMLSFSCNASIMQGILIDVAHILQLYFPLLERLIISYPRDNHFLLQFTACLYMTSSGINRFNRSTADSNLWTSLLKYLYVPVQKLGFRVGTNTLKQVDTNRIVEIDL